MTIAEQLQHQAECKRHLEELQAAASTGHHSGASSEEAAALLVKEYHCKECEKMLKLTTIDILKHKRMHAKQKQNS